MACPLGGSGTPREFIVQLCMYYVCISILHCPFIDYVEVSETKISDARKSCHEWHLWQYGLWRGGGGGGVLGIFVGQIYSLLNSDNPCMNKSFDLKQRRIERIKISLIYNILFIFQHFVQFQKNNLDNISIKS